MVIGQRHRNVFALSHFLYVGFSAPQDLPPIQRPTGLIKPFCPANIGCSTHPGARCSGHRRAAANGLLYRRLNATEPDSVISARGKISSAYAMAAAATLYPARQDQCDWIFWGILEKIPPI